MVLDEFAIFDTLIENVHPEGENKKNVSKKVLKYLLVHFLERVLAHKHEVDAATSAPEVDTFTVHLCALYDFRGSVNRSTDPR